MKIGITINNLSYTPEAYAYANYLEKFGAQIQLAEYLDPFNDVNIFFLGLKKNRSHTKYKEIHEYQSLSTPPFAKIKNFIKKEINCLPDARIFLNEIVKEDLNFNDQKPYVLRDMGVDEIFFQKPLQNHHYDIVYCGSFNGRIGLIEEIIRLAKIGFKICLIGSIDKDKEEKLKIYKNIDFIGKLKREEIPEYYKNSYAGLNYTPDIYPFNIQTSTKTIEYLASGLKCISNKYEWAENFSRSRNINFLWTNNIRCYEDLYKDERISIDLSDLEWNNILNNIDFYNFLRS